MRGRAPDFPDIRGMNEITITLPTEVVEELTRRVTEAVARSVEALRVPDLLTTTQAAAYLNCKRQRIYDLRSRGDLPVVREGGRILIRRGDLDALLEEA